MITLLKLSSHLCACTVVLAAAFCAAVPASATTTFSTATNLGSATGGSCPSAGSGTPPSISITGNGSGPVGNPGKQATDSYHLCTSLFSNNFTLTAHITSLSSGVKAGIQVRNTLTSDSSNVTLYTIGGSTLTPYTDRRQYDGAPNLSIDRTAWGANPPALDYAATGGLWMKLTRYGQEICLYYGSDNPADGTQPLRWWSASETAPLMGIVSEPNVGFMISGSSGSSALFDHITITTSVDTVTMPAPNLPYVTSWLGNDYPGGGGNFMIYRGQALATDPSGGVYIQGQGEVESAISLDTNAKWIAYYSKSHYNTFPGIAYACGLVFSAQAGFPTTDTPRIYGIGWYDPKGNLYGTINPNMKYNSLTSDPSSCTVYALEQGTGIVDVFTASSSNPSSTPTQGAPITLDGVTNATAVAYDKTSPGSLWALKVDGTTTHGQKYNLSGTAIGPELVGLNQPVALAVDTYGNVYISCSLATDQRIHVFTSSGAYKAVLGLQGGPHAEPVPGTIAYDSLDHPEGIAVDGNNNLYIASSGPATMGNNFGSSGMTLRKYSPNSGGGTPTVTSIGSGNLVWQKAGLEYIDGASPDPASDTDVYTKFHHYKVNYGTPGFTYQGDLLNDTDFPDDPRLNNSFRDAGSFIRTINGKKIQMVPSQDGKVINFYRFQSGHEYTIPYARLNRYTANGSLEIWVDQDLSGTINSSNPYCLTGTSGDGEESCTPSVEGNPSKDNFAWHLDADGNLWTAGENGSTVKIYEFTVQILSNGYPSWDTGHMTSWSTPAAFGSGTASNAYPIQLWHNTANDSLFIAGYTTKYPKDTTTNGGIGPGLLGNEIIRYDHWTTTPNPAVACEIPFATQAAPPEAVKETSDGVKSFDIAGGLIVTATDFSHRFEYYYGWDSNCATGTAPLRYTWLPGHEVGATMGTVDSVEVVNLLYDAGTSKWITFAEEGADMKILMFSYSDSGVPTPPTH